MATSEPGFVLPAPTSVVDVYPRLERWTWIAAVALWGVGDLLTTFISMEGGFGAEETEIVAMLIAEYGHVAHLGFKLVVFAALALAWRALPRPIRIAVPLAAAVAGAQLTLGNSLVIAAGL